MSLNKGSLWRKWDLHIHTPASIKHWKGTETYNNIPPSGKKGITEKVIEAINNSDVDVFCIMDYWTFDGYFELTNFIKDNDQICNSTIFPGIELRIEAPSDKRLNIHAILSNKLTDQQIKDFKSKLLLSTTERPLSNEALIAFAKQLDSGKAKEHGYEDPDSLSETKLLHLGFDTAEITLPSLKQAIDVLPANSCLIMLPYDLHGGARDIHWKEHPAADLNFLRSAHLFEARNQDNINLILGVKTSKNESFIDDFLKTTGKPKPVVSGSDAHSLSDYGIFPNGKITWIKADPTFEGLKQVLIEPQQRSFIGLKPQIFTRVQNNQTKYVSSISIDKKSDIKTNEIWFQNIFIEFNYGLVAIIGNKGMGKSALADILGLLGNADNEEYFSFLNKERFLGRDRKKGKASHYTASLSWKSGKKVTKVLGEGYSPNTPESVRYVPQNFFDKICNETELKKGGEFAQELGKIIFSHIEEHKKHNCLTLDELIKYKTEETEKSIELLKASLATINKKIVDLEKQLLPSYQHEIDKTIQLKQEELKSLEENQPEKVLAPENHNSATQSLEKIRKQKELRSSELTEILGKQKYCEDHLSKVSKLRESLETLKHQYHSWETNNSESLKILNINLDELISINFKFVDTLNQKQNALHNEAEKLEDEKRVAEQHKQQLTMEETQITNNLTKSAQAYELYQNEFNAWEQKKESLNKQINALNANIDSLKTVIPSQLKDLLTQRRKIVSEVFEKKMKLVEIFESLHKPVQDFIESHSLVKDKYKLRFEVSMDVKLSFVDDFLSFIRQNVRGTYRGKEPGKQHLIEKLEDKTFNTQQEVELFLEDILNSLKKDENNNDQKTEISEQLNSNKYTLEDFYDFLFSLDYVEPRYALKLDDKELPKLSPGERGILLLIFYLLIDKDDCPLIIDQPEENLDNQSVYELLVPCVEEAKLRRQIFLVTHNPNLAVVCDADQVIHAQIDKTNDNRVSYDSGSIENPDMNKRIVDILEGTSKAFLKREAMYQILHT